MDIIHWTPYPGHYAGQRLADRIYMYAEYKGLTLEIWEPHAGSFTWAFYDDKSPEPDLAVERSEAPFRTIPEAEADLKAAVESHVMA